MEQTKETATFKKSKMYERFFKRPMDFILSLSAIVFLSPLLIVIAILIRFKLGNPVIFKQKRPGLNEKIFTIYKFRTMTDKKDSEGNMLPDGDRLTPFGRFLRKTSTDELPELWNILIGEMSIVGPRPLLIKDMVFMTKDQRRRHTVRQGLTGWAQVNGRNSITWEDKLNLDLEYVNNITFLNDIKIILLTVVNVFNASGINTEGMDTAEDLGDYLLKRNIITKDQYLKKIDVAESLML